jgi:hypothetical protein
MGRIIVNKHFSDKSKITSENFVNKGEIVISNQVGSEGIYFTNTKGELFCISPTEGKHVEVPEDYKEYVDDVVEDVVASKISTQLDDYYTEGEVNALLEIISGITSEQIAYLSTISAYTVNTIFELSASTHNKIKELSGSTISEVSRIDSAITDLRKDFEDVSAGIVDKEYVNSLVESAITESLGKLEGDITEKVNSNSTHIYELDELINELSYSISGTINDLRNDLTALSAYTESIPTGGTVNPDEPVVGGLTEAEVRAICEQEIGFVVSGAPKAFDTLKEIADWISGDTTNTAAMVNDIEKLKVQLNAITLGVKADISTSVSNFYKGEETEVTVTGKISPSLLEEYTVNLYKGAVDGTLLSSSTDSSCVYTETITGDTTYGVKVIYNGTPYSAVTKISSYHPIYYGFGENYNTVVADGEKMKPTSSAKGNYKGTAETDGVNYFILVPNGVTKPTSFTMGGAPFNMSSTEKIINNVIYTVFKSGSVFNNGGIVDITAA